MTIYRMHVFPVILQRPLSRVLKHIAAGARPTKGHCDVTTLEKGAKKRTGGTRMLVGGKALMLPRLNNVERIVGTQP
jgi:hypothetical protein